MIQYHRNNSILALLVALLAGCSANPPQPNTCPNGFSGMAGIDETRYLVVHDIKAHREGVRLSVIGTGNERNITIDPVTVADWKHADGRASDLESVCKIPGSSNQYLAAESGHWDGKYGRLFHISLDESETSYRAEVIRAYDLPEFDAKGPNDPHGDEFEGMECLSLADDQVLVLLGERGGSPVYPRGTIRWFVVNTRDQALTWGNAGETGKQVNPPGVMDEALNRRDVTALYLDGDNALWAVSAEDAGDSGPFNSFVYQVGTVKPDPEDPVKMIRSTVAENIMSGLKTEALAGPTSEIPASRFSVGTEDECLGGIWRSLQ